MKKMIETIAIISALIFGLNIMATTAKQTKANTQNSYDVIVIGAGLGGLSTAATLTSMGAKVLIIDKNPYHVGGCTSDFTKTYPNGDKYTFEASLHQTKTLPFLYNQIGLKYNVIGGEDKKQYSNPDVTFIQFGQKTIDELYETVIDNGTDTPFVYQLPENIDRIEAKLLTEKQWSAETTGIKNYFNFLRCKFGKINPSISNIQDTIKASSAKEFIESLYSNIYKSNLSENNFSVDNLFDYFGINDSKLRALLSQYWVYQGPPTDSAWSPLLMLIMKGNAEGCVQIDGTSQALSDAFAKCIERSGNGTIHKGETVQKINLTKDKNGKKCVNGVTTDKGTYYANTVVSAIDPFHTFYDPKTGNEGFIGKNNTPERMKNLLKTNKIGNSLVDIYIPLDKTYKELGIPTDKYEVFFQKSSDSRQNYDAEMNLNYKASMAAVVLYSNLSKFETFKYAPKGKSELVITAYANSMDPAWWNDDSSQTIQKRADDLVKLAAKCLEDLALKNGKKFDKQKFFKAIRNNPDGKGKYIISTPSDIEFYTGQYKGVPYGWNYSCEQWYKRVLNKSQIGGLYLAGSWTLPSHGVSPAQLSGFLTAWWIIFDKIVGPYYNI